MSIGSICLVLHGHLPYVLRHGTWPHGEDWLYEAAAETYLPILAMIDQCAAAGASPNLTLGLTPVLLEQLAHDHFKDGFERYLEERLDRAAKDRCAFEAINDGHMMYLADQWTSWYSQQAEHFQRIGRDLPGAFAQWAAAGQIQILTSAATHAYLPLLCEDSSARAQLRAGLASSHRILGFKPDGLWLPECAYRPAGPWRPHVNWGGKDHRLGIERLVADETLTHFFVEHHLIGTAVPEFVRHDGQWHHTAHDEAARYPGRGWRSVNEPHMVNGDGLGPSGVTAFARDPAICERVWSAQIGYPGHGAYLEFHKKQGPKRGLRYWRITGRGLDLGQKQPYDPGAIHDRIREHAADFCNAIRHRLWEHHRRTGRHGIVTASFDAELFGHWWFEGPDFLREVVMAFHHDPDIDLITTRQSLDRCPPDKVVALPEGSWGEGGDHRVWADSRIGWLWEVEYRCEADFGKLTYELPWRQRPDLEQILQHAGRELLLLQASDWPFAITRGQAVDYGIKRFMDHVSRFEMLTALAEKVAANPSHLDNLTDVEHVELQHTHLHDVIFPTIDLNWWNA